MPERPAIRDGVQVTESLPLPLTPATREPLRGPALCFLAAALAALACGKDRQPEKPRSPPPPVMPEAAREMAAAAQRNPSAETEGESKSGDDAGTAREDEWIEGGSYRFRLEELRRCDTGAAPPAPGPAGQPLAPDGGTPSGASDWGGGTSWVGARVRVIARVNETIVSPRDLTLERGGVILQAKYVNPPVLRGCVPLLQQQQLRADQSVRGFALFEVPAHFRSAGAAPILLAYHPTRWGGARRVEIKLAPCFDACAAREPKQDNSASPRKRR